MDFRNKNDKCGHRSIKNYRIKVNFKIDGNASLVKTLFLCKIFYVTDYVMYVSPDEENTLESLAKYMHFISPDSRSDL